MLRAHIDAMIRLALLLLLAFAAPLAAGAQPGGLMWNRSGLPLTLPLQVKSDAGSDHYLLLHDPETGKAVLAAYARGGEFFRVLVPPGRYVLEIVSGRDWQGEEALFGADTTRVTLDPPLVFGTEGRARKSGVLVDLRGDAITLRSFGLCQRFQLDPATLPGSWARKHPADFPPQHPGDRFDPPRYRLTAQVCD